MSKALTNAAVFERPYDDDAGEPAVCRKFLGPHIRARGPFRLVRRSDGNQSARTNVTHRLIWHSPDGFEWGYGGSGPAELALNILAVFVVAWEAWRLEELFKWAVIARIPQKGATIERDAVAGWIEDVWAYEDQVGAMPDREMCATIADVRGCLAGVTRSSGCVVEPEDPDTGHGSPA